MKHGQLPEYEFAPEPAFSPEPSIHASQPLLDLPGNGQHMTLQDVLDMNSARLEASHKILKHLSDRLRPILAPVVTETSVQQIPGVLLVSEHPRGSLYERCLAQGRVVEEIHLIIEGLLHRLEV